MVHYWISDNGVGIPASALPRLFQVFQRFHPKLADGDGIGLASVRRLVERHGGTVWAESEAGRGTTFHFTLPAVQQETTS
jgi:signal transduction histidine kinase